MSTGGPPTLPPTQAPSTVEYGGDEISALVLDPGHAWTRAGFAGEDTPKSVIPSYYGYLAPSSATPDESSQPQFFFGDNEVHTLRPGMEIRNPMTDGIVSDWDAAPQLWRYALTSRLTKDLSEHPLLMTEPFWNPPRNREKTLEIAFEDFDVPAFYLAKAGVTGAFGSGKPSCIMVDFGASNIAVTPVHDGFILKKACQRAPIGGSFLSQQILAYLNSINVSITPHYQVISKSPVEVGKPADAVLKTFDDDDDRPTESWHQFQEERVLTEFKECTAQVWPNLANTFPFSPDGVLNPAFPQNQPALTTGRTFEFPDGFNLVFGPERYRITEGIFSPRYILERPTVEGSEISLGVHQLILEAAKNVDAELRPTILNNIVVTGAGSMLYGFTERLNAEMSAVYPGPRIRLTASGNSVERRYASWLGGSILASLGSFHQLWVSKKEYEEHGAGIVEKRCK